jgi:hypothetical protein
VASSSPISRSTSAVVSTGVPTGMSSTTWNSLLLSKGSILSTTSCTTASDTDRAIASTTPNHSSPRPPRWGSSSGVMRRRNRASSRG